MTISKELLKAIRQDLDAALASVAKIHNLAELRSSSCTFDRSGNFTFKVEGTVEGGLDKDASRYEANRIMFGLPPLGTKFKSNNKEHTICGMNSTASKVYTDATDGKKYQFPRDQINRLAGYKDPRIANVQVVPLEEILGASAKAN